jgi:uncharacterized membrane protein YidH (DUF202 family)
MPLDDPEDADPALGAERTRLAWTRTAIAFAAVGGATLRRDVLAGLLILAGTPVIWALGNFAGRALPAEQRSRRLLLVTAAVTAIALFALALAIARAV